MVSSVPLAFVLEVRNASLHGSGQKMDLFPHCRCLMHSDAMPLLRFVDDVMPLLRFVDDS